MQDGSNQRLVIYGLLYASLLALHIASSNKSEHLLLVFPKLIGINIGTSFRRSSHTIIGWCLERKKMVVCPVRH